MLSRITSPEPSRYRMVAAADGAEVHVFCALDTLEYALISGCVYRVEGTPPIGPSVCFNLNPEGPDASEGWMSYVRPDLIAGLPEARAMPSRCCPFVHFFASKAAYVTWHRSLPAHVRAQIELLPLDIAWDRARDLMRECLADPSCSPDVPE